MASTNSPAPLAQRALNTAAPGTPRSRLLRWLLGLSLTLFIARVAALQGLGFGDSEALYASYALFPQPAYLDHPGLVGAVMRLVGWGGAPSPSAAHLLAAFIAALVPWIGATASRAFGADSEGAWHAGLALLLVPELAVGLSALTPDLLLAPVWLAALGFAAAAFRAVPGSRAAYRGWLSVGALVGVAFAAKVSGALLGVAVALAVLTSTARGHLKTAAPWLGAAVSLLLASPILAWEAQRGFPMLEHRLVTQVGGGVSWTSLGKFVGGQLLYVGPLFLIALALIGKRLFAIRHTNPVTWLGFVALVVPGVPLTLLSLVSEGAEPHWIAPALLPLALIYGQNPTLPRWVMRGAWVNGLLVVVALFVWVQTDLPVRWLGDGYRARFDLTNDLYAWGPGRSLLAEAVERAALETHRMPVVVGPHWVVCAQAQAALGPQVRVGCNTPRRDDFDGWYPRAAWLSAPVVLYVYDDRFDVHPASELPGRNETARSKADVRRAGRVVRSVRVSRLEKSEAVGRRGAPAAQ
jgi:hypothetical protein